MSLWRGNRRVLAAALALLGLGSSPATVGATTAGAASTAGSIVFVKGGNIWSARPDGVLQRQITRDGTSSSPYEYPTQANNGTIEALRGTKLYHLNRRGKWLNKRFKVATGPNNPMSLHTLAQYAAISPDGNSVAFSRLEYQGVYNPNTGVKGTSVISQDVVVGNAWTGKLVETNHLAGTYLTSPSWVDNQRLLLFAPYNISAPQVYLDVVGKRGYNWFADTIDGDGIYDRKILSDGAVTRAGDKLAAIRGTNLRQDWRSASLQFYAVHGFGTPPTPLCSIKAQHGMLGKPTWSPDGSTVAWSDSNGVWVSPLNTAASGCGLAPRLVVRAGWAPSWGPAAP